VQSQVANSSGLRTPFSYTKVQNRAQSGADFAWYFQVLLQSSQQRAGARTQHSLCTVAEGGGKCRRCYTPPAVLQGEIRDDTTAIYFFFLRFPELSGMLYGLLLLLSYLKT